MSKTIVVVVLSVLALVLVGCSGSDVPSMPACVPLVGSTLANGGCPETAVKATPVQVKVEPTVAPAPKAVGKALDMAAIAVRCGQLAGNDVAKTVSCVKCFQSGGTDWYKTDSECLLPTK